MLPTPIYICLTIYLCIYFTIQSISDIKTKEVYVSLNNITLFITASTFLFKLITLPTYPDLYGFLLLFIIPVMLYIIYRINIFGIGDLKAYLSVYFYIASSKYVSLYPLVRSRMILNSEYTYDLYFIFCVVLLLSMFLPLIVHRLIKREKKEIRYPAFPYIFVSLLIFSHILLGLNYTY